MPERHCANPVSVKNRTGLRPAETETGEQRPALANRTPMAVWREGQASATQMGAVDMMDKAAALPTCHSKSRSRSVWLHDNKGKERQLFDLNKPGQWSASRDPDH
jgi:hypothetical protein